MNTPLPPQGPHEPDDELPDETGLAALYRKLPQSEPGPALDAAVLHAAAQAIAGPVAARLPQGERRKAPREPGDWVRPKPASEVASLKSSPSVAASHTPRHRGLVALASAASLMLAAGLAWHMRKTPSPVATPATPRAAAGSSVTVSAPAAPATRQATADKRAPGGLVTQDHPASSAVGGVASDPAMPAAATTPAKLMASDRVAAPTVSAKTIASPAMKDQSMDAQAASTARLAQRRPESASPTSPPPVAELSAGLPVTEPTQAAPAPPPPPVEEVSTAPVMAPAPALPSPPHIIAVAPSAGLPDASAARDVVSPEARELEAIRQLFAQRHDVEGRQRLQDFHRLHPQWPLPADLQGQLRKP